MANPARVFCNVKSVEQFGEGVYSVAFDVDKRFTKFLPGQFLHLALDEFDPTTGYWPESRVFSIASEPRHEVVKIVYSVKGAFTKRMAAELLPGKEVWLKFPYGNFVIDEDLLLRGPVVLIAGGTGVSPYLSFLKRSRESLEPIHLFYGVRNPSHLLFREDLGELQTRPWFQLHLMIEDGQEQTLPFKRGRLSIDGVVKQLDQTFGKCHFFLSGPPPMIRTFRQELRERETDDSRIHIDEWE